MTTMVLFLFFFFFYRCQYPSYLHGLFLDRDIFVHFSLAYFQQACLSTIIYKEQGSGKYFTQVVQFCAKKYGYKVDNSIM